MVIQFEKKFDGVVHSGPCVPMTFKEGTSSGSGSALVHLTYSEEGVGDSMVKDGAG